MYGWILRELNVKLYKEDYGYRGTFQDIKFDILSKTLEYGAHMLFEAGKSDGPQPSQKKGQNCQERIKTQEMGLLEWLY